MSQFSPNSNDSPIPTTIHTLPNELLSKIFKSGTLVSSHRMVHLFQVLVCSINQHWRTVALNTPDLWTIIHVTFAPNAHNKVSYTSCWLDRSKSCPFDITINLPEETAGLEQDIAGVVNLIIKHICRLRRLVIKGHGQNDALVWPLLAEFAPRLEELQTCFQNQSITLLSRRDLLRGGTPLLSSLRLQGVQVSPPSVGLTTLDVHTWQATYVEFRDIVTSSPSLTALVLRKFCGTQHHITDEHVPIEIPSLRSFALSFYQSHIHIPQQSLLPLLSMPNLEYLELAGEYFPDLSVLLPNLTGNTKLHTIALSHLPFRLGIYIPFLRALGMITHLQLIHTPGETILPTRIARKSLPRTRSINFRDERARLAKPALGAAFLPAVATSPDERTSADSTPMWPHLHTITLDTFRADDLVWLCAIIPLRGGIKRVKLSHSAGRHLSSSLMKNGGVVDVRPRVGVNLGLHRGFGGPSHRFEGDGECPYDGQSWLRGCVEVERIGARDGVFIGWEEH